MTMEERIKQLRSANGFTQEMLTFVGFFLPLVVAFASRNAARFAFLETQDCIGHNSSSSFLRRVIF